MNPIELHTTLPEPKRPNNIPAHAQWLSGEGAGSWFLLERYHSDFLITRFSAEGEVECKGIFNSSGEKIFNMNKEYEFAYISHCSLCTIMQDDAKFIFLLKSKI